MNKKNSESDNYDSKETENRMTAALRGARLVGHKPMKTAKKASAKSKRISKRK